MEVICFFSVGNNVLRTPLFLSTAASLFCINVHLRILRNLKLKLYLDQQPPPDTTTLNCT